MKHNTCDVLDFLMKVSLTLSSQVITVQEYRYKTFYSESLFYSIHRLWIFMFTFQTTSVQHVESCLTFGELRLWSLLITLVS